MRAVNTPDEDWSTVLARVEAVQRRRWPGTQTKTTKFDEFTAHIEEHVRVCVPI